MSTEQKPGRGRVYASITETIGNTPLVRLDKLAREKGVKATILAKLEYAELDTHRQEHQKLLRRANSLYQAARTGELTNLALLDFVLQDLVLGHMVKQDRRYFPLLKASMQEETLLSPDGPLTSPPPGLVKH